MRSLSLLERLGGKPPEKNKSSERPTENFFKKNQPVQSQPQTPIKQPEEEQQTYSRDQTLQNNSPINASAFAEDIQAQRKMTLWKK